MIKYLKLWWMMGSLSTQVALKSTLGAVLFLIAKFLRFALFFLFISILGQTTQTIGGFTIPEMILFFATFNLVDVIPQFLFREVYKFRTYVSSGELDYILTKPLSPLYRSLLGGSDILDLPMILASVGLLIYAINLIQLDSQTKLLLFLFLIINSFLIALSFHIFTLGVGILTTNIDSTIMLYRDLTQMGRFPVDIYLEPARSILTFAIPIGIMMTFPAKVLLGLLSFEFILLSLGMGLLLLLLSIKFWGFALKKYQSASS